VEGLHKQIFDYGGNVLVDAYEGTIRNRYPSFFSEHPLWGLCPGEQRWSALAPKADGVFRGELELAGMTAEQARSIQTEIKIGIAEFLEVPIEDVTIVGIVASRRLEQGTGAARALSTGVMVIFDVAVPAGKSSSDLKAAMASAPTSRVEGLIHKAVLADEGALQAFENAGGSLQAVNPVKPDPVEPGPTSGSMGSVVVGALLFSAFG
jgi:hypothetical protein